MTPRRSNARWTAAFGIVPLLVIALALLPALRTQAATYTVSVVDTAGSDDLAITPDGKFAAVVGAGASTTSLGLINLTSTPPATVGSSTPLNAGTQEAVSVAVGTLPGGAAYTAVVALNSGSSTAGNIAFVDIDANGARTLRPTTFPAGVNPESVDIAPNSRIALVANRGARSAATNTSGSVTVVDLRGPTPLVLGEITTFGSVTNPSPETVVFQPLNPAQPDQVRAFVTLQPNGAIAIVDITVPESGPVAPPTVNATAFPNIGPDGIAVTSDGQYLVTADRGVINSVDVFKVTGTSIAAGATVPTNNISGASYIPRQVAVGTLAGATAEQFYVTLRAASGTNETVGVFNLDRTANGSLSLAEGSPIALNEGSSTSVNDPEGIAVVPSANLILTANSSSTNVSIIAAAPGQATPTVTGTPGTPQPTTTGTPGTPVPTGTPGTPVPTETGTTTPTAVPTPLPGTPGPRGWLPYIQQGDVPTAAPTR